jgi:hypothetical protein
MSCAADRFLRWTHGLETGSRNERGVALPVALFALIVIGALVCGNFFAGMLEQQSGRNTLYATQAFEAAEAGLTDLITSASPSELELLGVGGLPADLGSLDVGEGVSVGRQVRRLTANLFLLRATGIREGAAGAPLAVRTLGLIVRMAVAPPTEEPARATARLLPIAERAWIPLY